MKKLLNEFIESQLIHENSYKRVVSSILFSSTLYYTNTDNLNETSIYQSVNETSNLMNKYLLKMSTQVNSFSKNSIEPYKLFKENIKIIYDEIHEEYNEIIESTKIAIQNIEGIKSKFFDAIAYLDFIMKENNIDIKETDIFNKLKDLKNIINLLEVNLENYKTDNDYKIIEKPLRNYRRRSSVSSTNVNLISYPKEYYDISSQIQILYVLLNYEIQNFNNTCDFNEKRYKTLIKKISNNEESKISFMQSQENKFSKFFSDLGSIFTDLGKELETKSNNGYNSMLKNKTEILVEKEENIINNYTTNSADILYLNTRVFKTFKPIEYVKESIDIIDKQTNILINQSLLLDELENESISKSNNNHISNNSSSKNIKLSNDTNTNIDLKKNNSQNSIENNPYLPSLKRRYSTNRKDKFLNNSNSFPYLSNKESQISLDSNKLQALFESFVSKIYINSEIEDVIIRQILRLVFVDVKSIRLMLNALITSHNKINYLKVPNLKNLISLKLIFDQVIVLIYSNHLSFINSNSKNDVKSLNIAEYDEMITDILYISERIYNDNNQKIFLCNLCSENYIFKSRKFWEDIVKRNAKNKIVDKIINTSIFNLINLVKYNLTQNSNEKQTNNFTQPNLKGNTRNNSMLSWGDKLKNIFSTKSKESGVTPIVNKDNKDGKLIRKGTEESNNSNNSFDGYDNLSDKEKEFQTNQTKSLKDLRTITIPKSSLAKFDQELFEGIKSKISNINHNLSSDQLKQINELLINPNIYQITLVDLIKNEEFLITLKNLCNYLSNYNFCISESMDIIVDMFDTYNLQSDKLSFLITIINSSVFSLKSSVYKQNKLYLISNFNKQTDSKSNALINSMKYLSKKECLNLTLLNKNIYSKIMTSYCSNELLLINDNFNFNRSNSSDSENSSSTENSYEIKNISIDNKYSSNLKQRIILWQYYLNSNKVKLKFSYEDLKQRVDQINLYIQKNKSSLFLNTVKDSAEQMTKNFDEKLDSDILENFNIISLDVPRTYFKENVDERRKQIDYVLKSFVLAVGKKSYCQGMNYIVSFLLVISNSEEIAFNIFISLYTNTDFGVIFNDDLGRLKQFFYVFDRLIIQFIPELNSYFYHNNVGSSYYCSPWFMTLFTNCSSVMDESASNVLLKIWDEFILYGWKTILKTGLVLLKTYRDKLMSFKQEDMLNFLFNDILKSGFFTNKNYTNFIKMWNELVIPNELMNNLDNEYLQDLKIQEQYEKVSKNINDLLNNNIV